MNKSLYANTDYLYLCIGYKNIKGFYLFANDNSSIPGVQFTPKGLLPVQAQIIEHVESNLSKKLNTEITFHDFKEIFYIDEKSISLYLITLEDTTDCIEKKLPSNFSWRTINKLIHDMPKDKTRVVYMKIIQYLATLNTEDTKVILSKDLTTPYTEN